MKKDKKRFKEAFSEAFGELVLFGIGAFILWLFGWGWDSVDGDLIVLIGIAVIVVLGLIVSLAEWIKKKPKVNENESMHLRCVICLRRDMLATQA